MRDIAIIGGGLVGLCAALALHITLYLRLSKETSSKNAFKSEVNLSFGASFVFLFLSD